MRALQWSTTDTCLIAWLPPAALRRHVVLPQDIAKLLPKGVLLSEVRPYALFELQFWQDPGQPCGLTQSLACLQNEWRQLGVQQSRGWVHYAIHRPEPHIMLFR